MSGAFCKRGFGREASHLGRRTGFGVYQQNGAVPVLCLSFLNCRTGGKIKCSSKSFRKFRVLLGTRSGVRFGQGLRGA